MKQAAVVASWALAILVGCSPIEGPPQVAEPDAQDTRNVDALQVTEPEIVARRELVASDVDPAVAARRTVVVVKVVATSKPEIIKTHGGHMSSRMGDVDGGGYVTWLYCRQTFDVISALSGDYTGPELELEYSYLDKTLGCLLPPETRPIQIGETVSLALGVNRSLVAVIPDDERSRDTLDEIVRYVRNRPPVARSLMHSMDAFTIKIQYLGPEPDEFFSAICTTSRDRPDCMSSQWLIMQNLSHVWAHQALDHLIRSDWWRASVEQTKPTDRPPVDHCYTISVVAGLTEVPAQPIGCGKVALKRLEKLAGAIQYDGGVLSQFLSPLSAAIGKPTDA